MNPAGFGFHFEQAGRGGTHGAIDPAEQFFEGSRFEVSITRETGQNSGDADNGDGPVRMKFELAEMATSEIPGIEGLREHLSQVEVATRGSQGYDRMLGAKVTASRESLTVLRISDYGTKGLLGSESMNHSRSPLSALTRGAGISADDGDRGGSFGIGSAVGPMASDVCTVFYTSLPCDQTEVVFAGYSRLASHQDASGTWRVGDGFFTKLVADDFEYLRDPDPFGPFEVRTTPGTDLYVIGYRKAAEDPGLSHIRDAFIDNFMMAIHEGRLEVSGEGMSEPWNLTAATLEVFANARPESQAFYRAIQDPDPVQMNTERSGDVRLYINVDPSLTKTLSTITMRKPLMKIDTFKHTSIPAKYAAVLVCDDPKGNTLLRDLEPPQHNCWDAGRSAVGPAAIRELKDLVRRALRERVHDRVGDIVEIKGLSRYLPSDTLSVPVGGEPARPGIGEGTAQESATVQGDPDAADRPEPRQRQRVTLPVQRAAQKSGNNRAWEGKDSGGTGSRTSSKTKIEGDGEPGEGRSRIAVGEVRFRSWSTTGLGLTLICVSLTSPADASGDIELVPLGAGGDPESGYELPIRSARMFFGGSQSEIEWEGNLFKDVQLLPDQPTRLEIELEGRHRYRLDLK